MRWRIRPAPQNTSGSTLIASVPLPVGASHSSQASPSTISAASVTSASTRASRMVASGGWLELAGWGGTTGSMCTCMEP